MLQSAARVKPDASFRVIVRQEETVLRGGAQTLYLRQLFSQILTRVNYRGLKQDSLKYREALKMSSML